MGIIDKFGEMLKGKSKSQEPLDRYQNLVKKEPGNAKAHLKLAELYQKKGDKKKAVAEYLTASLPKVPFLWSSLLGWWCVHALGKIVGQAGYEGQSRSWIDEWLLGIVIAGALRDQGLDEPEAWQVVGRIKWLTSHQRWFALDAPSIHARAYHVLETLLKDDQVQQFLQVNRYQGVLWFNKEAFEQLLWWLTLLAVVEIGVDPLRPEAEVTREMLACYEVVQLLHRAEEKSDYQVEKLLSVV